MQITVNKYSHGWFVGTKWQVCVYQNNSDKTLYFYGRTYKEARKRFNRWLGEKLSELPEQLNQANKWYFGDNE